MSNITIPFQKRCIIYKIYVFVSKIFTKILQWLTFLDTREKKNNHEELFVLILYYILANWLYL